MKLPRWLRVLIAILVVIAILAFLVAVGITSVVYPAQAQSPSNIPWSWVSISAKVTALQGQKVTVTVNVRNTTTEGRDFGLHVWHGGPAWNGSMDDYPYVSWGTTVQREYCNREIGCSFYWTGYVGPGQTAYYQIKVTTSDFLGYAPFAKVFDEDHTELVEIIMTIYPAFRQYLPLALHH